MPGHALLAPIPKMHLDSALAVLSKKAFVCFASDTWEPFKTLEMGSKIYIYVSHAEEESAVRYEGVFCGIVTEPVEMKKLEKEGFRPATTVGEKCGLFWKVREINPLSRPLPLSSIQLASGKYLKSYPRGPLQVVS